MKADIKLCDRSFSVVTLPLFSQLVKVIIYRHICFVSDKGMFSMGQKVYCILWQAQLISYTYIRCKFNHVFLNQTAPIYRSVMCWDKHLK